MTQLIEPTEVTTHFLCRHIFTDGHRCGGKSLRHEAFCYFHHQTRRPAYHRHLAANKKSAFALPAFEDRTAVQSAIHEIASRLAANQLDARRAGLLLYAMQIALQTHPRLPVAAPAQPLDMVDEITLHPTLGELAPEAEFVLPERERTLEEILMHQWHQEP
jgi:hypothetical protein